MERSARGGERASIAILHRTEIDTGTAGVTGCEGGWVPAGGFCIFRESITNSSANISGAWLSAMLGDLRDSFRPAGSSLRAPYHRSPPTGIEFHSKLIPNVSEIDTVAGGKVTPIISDTFFRDVRLIASDRLR